MLDEQELKCRLLSKLRQQRMVRASTVIASEFVLGRTGCRSDLAISNGDLIGIEVKSARDSLARLPEQMAAYHKLFDQVILVCDEMHHARAEAICTPNVGIYVWRLGKLEVFREASANNKMDRLECVRSLGIKHLQSCLRLDPSAKYPRRALEEGVLNDRSIDVRRLLIDAFRAAYRPTTERFMREIVGKRVTSSHLVHLSRFAEARAEWRAMNDARQGFWRRWQEQAEAVFG